MIIFVENASGKVFLSVDISFLSKLVGRMLGINVSAYRVFDPDPVRSRTLFNCEWINKMYFLQIGTGFGTIKTFSKNVKPMIAKGMNSLGA